MAHPPQAAHYPWSEREELLPFVPEGCMRVLEVGCGSGGFSHTLRKVLGRSCRIIGVEAVPGALEVARERGMFDELLQGYFPEVLQGSERRFDLVVFNDVLEHMVDPWAVLSQTREYLNGRGRVLASIPNVQFAPVVWGLLRGEWRYTDLGVLDATHLRFFTRRSMTRMFEEAGYQVELIQGVNGAHHARRGEKRPLLRLVKRVAPMILDDSLFQQFAVVARPN